MSNADEDALRAMRAASPALQKWWRGESPRSWKGVTWSDDRVQGLYLDGSKLEVLPPQIGQLRDLTTLSLRSCPLKELPPQIGQLRALDSLKLYGSGLEVLPPQIGQLDALTYLGLRYCPLKELPPEIGQLLALNDLFLDHCEQLTRAPGAKQYGQPAQTTVAAYARLLIVEPHKDTTDQLHAFLLANPLALPTFLKHIVTDATHAVWLGEAVKAAPSLAGLTDADGRRAIDVAHSACKQAMQAALFLLGRFEVDDGPLLHVSATAAVAAATDHGDPEAKPVPRVALKAMRGVKQDSDELEGRAGAEQVCAELEGRVGLDPKRVVAVKAVYADEKAIAGAGGAEAWQLVKDAAAELGVEAEVKPGLSDFIQAHFFKKQEVDRPSAGTDEPATLDKHGTELTEPSTEPTEPTLDDASSKYTYLLVMELADRSLATALMHDRIAANEWPLVRKIGGDLARGLDNLHVEGGRIHADFKPLNICRVPEEQDNFTTFFDWALIDFDVSCLFDEGFGSKLPSSGYCPPEMAKVLLKATDPNTFVLVNKEELSVYTADVAYDLWSFGVVLFHLGTGKSLWHTNQEDSISQVDLRKLAGWDQRQLERALRRFKREDQDSILDKNILALQHLVRKLLEPIQEQRLTNFSDPDGIKSKMQMVLQHPFLAAKTLDDAVLQTVSDQIKEVGDKLDLVIEMGLEHRIELQHTCQVLHRSSNARRAAPGHLRGNRGADAHDVYHPRRGAAARARRGGAGPADALAQEGWQRRRAGRRPQGSQGAVRQGQDLARAPADIRRGRHRGRPRQGLRQDQGGPRRAHDEGQDVLLPRGRADGLAGARRRLPHRDHDAVGHRAQAAARHAGGNARHVALQRRRGRRAHVRRARAVRARGVAQGRPVFGRDAQAGA
eukprot:scaffold41172_cov54-Phaeocystis_antarctica.AAC.2